MSKGIKHDLRLAGMCVGLACVFACGMGCGDSEPTSSAPSSDAATKMQAGDNVDTGAAVIHDLKDVKEGQGYKITPADPSKKEFQADPRIAGGG